MDNPQLLFVLPTLDNLPPLTPPEGVTLRSYAEGDAKHWDDIIANSFFNTTAMTFESGMLTDPSYKPERVWFACAGDKNEPVATASAFFRKEHGADTGYIHMVGTHHVSGGKGYGYWATLAALHQLKKEGYAQAALTTDDFRLPAIKTYLKLGFKLMDNHPSVKGRWAAIEAQLEARDTKRAPLNLWPGDVPDFNEAYGQARPTITPFLVKGSEPRGAVIVCPGGGYYIKAGHEGEPIARMLNAHGIHAFVLDYRVRPYLMPAILKDAQRAIRYVRSNAAALGVKPDRIGILGFSAGGHLSGMTAVHWDNGDPGAADPVERVSSRPDCFIPCYSVLKDKYFVDEEARCGMLGEDLRATEEQRKWFSVIRSVAADTPPCFMWHTVDDDVSVTNSLCMALALSEHKVKYALHVFPYGPHGLGLAERVPYTANWGRLCAEWLLAEGYGE